MKNFISKFLPDPAPDNDLPDLSLRIADDPIRNGVHAEQLLNDPLLRQCFENVRAAYLRKFEDLPHSDVDQLKLVHLSLLALKEVRSALLAYQFNGQTKLKQSERDGDAQTSRPMMRKRPSGLL